MTVQDLMEQRDEMTKQAFLGFGDKPEYDAYGRPIPKKKSTLLPTLGILAGLGGAGYLGHRYGDQILEYLNGLQEKYGDKVSDSASDFRKSYVNPFMNRFKQDVPDTPSTPGTPSIDKLNERLGLPKNFYGGANFGEPISDDIKQLTKRLSNPYQVI